MNDVVYVSADKLVEDLSVYPRLSVDKHHVDRIAESIIADPTSDLPPLVVCKDTLRIVDGFHRRRAMKKAYGEDTEVPVLFKKYANDGELFADAVRFNTGHGKQIPLDDVDFIIRRAKAFGLSDISVSKSLRVSVKRLGELSVNKETVVLPDRPPVIQSIPPEPRKHRATMDMDGCRSLPNGTGKDVDGDTGCLLWHLQESIRLMKSDDVLKTDKVELAIKQLAELFSDRNKNIDRDSVRRRLASFLSECAGPVSLLRISNELKIQAVVAETVLTHEWFLKTSTGGYFLTQVGHKSIMDQ